VLAAGGRVRFTLKALHELAALDLGFDEADACDILKKLGAADFRERLTSETTGEWMYVFVPRIAAVRLYLKVILRADCVVVSLHEQVDHEQAEEDHE
jgi:ribose 5-phosphate isomerase